jgi:Tfp pilus assembly protein PilF
VRRLGGSLAVIVIACGACACASAGQAALQARYPINFNVTRVGGALTMLETRDSELKDALSAATASATTDHYLAVARRYVESGVPDRAFDYLQRSLTVNGPDARVHDALARVWRDWGLPSAGLGDSYRAISLAPRSAAVHNTLGTLLLRLGYVNEALAQFTAALELDPSAWYAQANLCHVHLSQGQTLLAIAECQDAAARRKKGSPWP